MTTADDYRVTIARAAEPGWARSWGGFTYRLRRNSWSQVVKYQAGDWVVHCPLCKDRAHLPDRDSAFKYALKEHPTESAHQRWTGVVAQGGTLPTARGYDSTAGLQSERNINGGSARERQAEFRARCASPVRQDDLAARRVVAPPQIRWSTGDPLGPATVTWADGRYSSGTFYDLYANGVRVDRIVALSEGGWLFNGKYLPDDQALIRAAS